VKVVLRYLNVLHSFSPKTKGICFLVNLAGVRNSDIREIINETKVEICKTEEGLNVLDLLQFGPLLNGLYFVGGLGETGRRQDVAKIFDTFAVELTFLWFGIQPMLPELAEDLLDLFMVSSFIGRINENIVKVDDDTNVQHISEDVVNEALESPNGITNHPNEPYLVRKVVFHSSPSRM